MITINWAEFKEFKKHRHGESQNFPQLLDFIRSYYNISNAKEIFDTLRHDELSNMMLNKRNITDAVELEKYLFKTN